MKPKKKHNLNIAITALGPLSAIIKAIFGLIIATLSAVVTGRVLEVPARAI